MSNLGYFLLSLLFALGGFGIGASIAMHNKHHHKEYNGHDENFKRH